MRVYALKVCFVIPQKVFLLKAVQVFLQYFRPALELKTHNYIIVTNY
ncbi:hypothetical protein M23134_03283 [Microscilla marina ATCC 23134]|uniref:Uncharacterized protein n=1 Tax=Microscilla marina ATCC 23134 TaxID=313606 RepID=A1ZGM8_MICM2|nr:hypothetical protein M23134_03283 [Microscilla marina ATCC 23134]